MDSGGAHKSLRDRGGCIVPLETSEPSLTTLKQLKRDRPIEYRWDFILSKREEGARKYSWITLFLDIVEAAYLGNEFEYEGRSFKLKPTLVMPYDFLKRTSKADTEYERLLGSLDPRFKEAADSEMYRRGEGWISRGVGGYYGTRIRRIESGDRTYLLPVISEQPSVGIDTSSIQNKTTVIGFCFIADQNAG